MQSDMHAYVIDYRTPSCRWHIHVHIAGGIMFYCMDHSTLTVSNATAFMYELQETANQGMFGIAAESLTVQAIPVSNSWLQQSLQSTATWARACKQSSHHKSTWLPLTLFLIAHTQGTEHAVGGYYADLLKVV